MDKEKRIFKLKRKADKKMVYKAKVKVGVDKAAILQSAYYNGFLDKHMEENGSPADYMDTLNRKVDYIKFIVEFNAYNYKPDEIAELLTSKLDVELLFDLVTRRFSRLASMGLTDKVVRLAESMITILDYLEQHDIIVSADNDAYTIKRSLYNIKAYAQNQRECLVLKPTGIMHHVMKDNVIILSTNVDLVESIAYIGSNILVQLTGNTIVKVPYSFYRKLQTVDTMEMYNYFMQYSECESATRHGDDGDEEDIEVGTDLYDDYIRENYIPVLHQYNRKKVRYEGNTISELIACVFAYTSVEDGVIELNHTIFSDDYSNIWNPVEGVRLRLVDGTKIEMSVNKFMTDYFGFVSF